jgi:hypothetical protein
MRDGTPLPGRTPAQLVSQLAHRVLERDPDGFLLELIERPPAVDSPPGAHPCVSR